MKYIFQSLTLKSIVKLGVLDLISAYFFPIKESE